MWQKVAYQLDDITPDQTQDIRQTFEELTKAHDAMGNVCGFIAALSTDLKGPGIKMLLQNTIRPLINVKVPLDIFDIVDTGDREDKEEDPQVDNLKGINKNCFPWPSRIEDANDGTCALAALAYFKLKQQVLGGTEQFEAAARYKVTQKNLIGILHGKKYLGGKQKQH